MQWSGLTGGAAPFEPLAPSQSQSTQQQSQSQSHPLFDRTATLRPKKTHYGGSAIPYNSLPVATRPLELPLTVVEKPRQVHHSQANLEPFYAQQFAGYGVSRALPTEFVQRPRKCGGSGVADFEEDVGMQARVFPAQRSQWERMMSWMPRQVQFEGFTGAATSAQKANALLAKFWGLYNYATKYYLDAVIPVPKTINTLTNYEDPNTRIKYSLTTSGNIAGSSPLNLFDEKSDTRWTVGNPGATWNTSATSGSRWVQVTLSRATTLTAIAVSQSNNGDRSFTGFIVYGSNTLVGTDVWSSALYTSTAADATRIAGAAPPVAVTVTLPAPTAAYLKYRIVFTGATNIVGGNSNISMHTLQLYGGDIPVSLYNLIKPWTQFYSVSGSVYTVNTTDNSNPKLGEDSLAKYRFYKMEITEKRNAGGNGVEMSRFRFVKEDGSDYVWNTKAVDTSAVQIETDTDVNDVNRGGCRASDVDTTGAGTFTCQTPTGSAYATNYNKSILFGTSSDNNGDFITNPGGYVANTVGFLSGNSYGGIRTDGFNELPNTLLINDYTSSGVSYSFPIDRNSSDAWINRNIKKWLNRNNTATLIFILKEPQLFTALRFFTGNDLTSDDPKSWKLYGTNTPPYSDITIFKDGKFQFKETDRTPTWITLNTYTNAEVTTARQVAAGPFIMYQSTESLRQAFSSAYKELVQIIIQKYKAVADSMQLSNDATVIDSLDTSCNIIASAKSITIQSIYGNNAADLLTVGSQQITRTDADLITINDTPIIDAKIAEYIDMRETTPPGAWPTLYQRIKCIAINPIKEYIDYVNTLSAGATLPSGFPTRAGAQGDVDSINSTTNVISVMSIVSLYELYRELIKKAKAYFLIKQFQYLVDTSDPTRLDIFDPAIKTADATAYTFTGSKLATITTLRYAYSEGTTLISGEALPNITNENYQDVTDTFAYAISDIAGRILEKYKSFYEEFSSIGMVKSATTDTYYTQSSEPLPTSVLDVFNSAKNFLTTGFEELRKDIRAFLRDYANAFNSVRTWFTCTSGTQTVASISTQCMSKTTAILAIAEAEIIDLATTVSIITLSGKRASYVGNMGSLIGAYNADKTVRNAIYDQIVAIRAYYDANVGYLASSYSWIASDSDTDESTIKSSTNLSILVQIWNKYNILLSLQNTVNAGKRRDLQDLINLYNNLYDKYVAFQGAYGTYTSYTMAPLPTEEITRVTDIVNEANYNTLFSKYDNGGTGMFQRLVAFVRTQMGSGSYIPAFYSAYDTVDQDLQSKEIDIAFYGSVKKDSDVSATPSKSANELITLLSQYTTYTEQLKARNDKYNTLIVMQYFSNLALANKTTTEIFPPNLVTELCPPSEPGDSLNFVTESGATIILNAGVNGLICNMEADIALVLTQTDDGTISSEATANLKTIRNKYIAAFNLLFDELKSNMQREIGNYEILFDEYTAFQQKFAAYSPLDVFSESREPTPVDSPTSYKSSLNTFAFNDSNQQAAIDLMNNVRNAYLATDVGSVGVYVALQTMTDRSQNTNLNNFISKLSTHISTSPIPAGQKPVLPLTLSLSGLAATCADLTVKEYKYLFTTNATLRTATIDSIKPNAASTDTYASLSGVTPSIASITDAGNAFWKYSQATAGLFDDLKTQLATRIGDYKRLHERYTLFTSEIISSIDARDADRVDPIPTNPPYPDISGADSDKTATENLSWPTAGVGGLDTLRVKYGQDTSSTTPTGEVYLERIIQWIKGELEDYVGDYDSLWAETPAANRPLTSRVPISNPTTNTQNLIDVMNSIVPLGNTLVTGITQSSASAAIQAYIDLYDAYDEYLTVADISGVGANTDGKSYSTLRTDANTIRTDGLTEMVANTITSRYTYGKTGLDVVIIARLKQRAKDAMIKYHRVYEAFKSYLDLDSNSESNSDLLTPLTEYGIAQGSGFSFNTFDKDGLIRIYSNYTTTYFDELTTLIRDKTISEIEDYKTTYTSNNALLSMPLQGSNVLNSAIKTPVQADADVTGVSSATSAIPATPLADPDNTTILYYVLAYLKPDVPNKGIKYILDDELIRLAALKTAREQAMATMEYFYDICYKPFETLLTNNGYSLPSAYPITSYIQSSKLTNAPPRDLATAMTDTFNALPPSSPTPGATSLATLTEKYGIYIGLIAQSIKDAMTGFLEKYRDLYNKYNGLATAYSAYYTDNIAGSPGSTLLSPPSASLPSWPTSTPTFIATNITSKPISNQTEITTALGGWKTLFDEYVGNLGSLLNYAKAQMAAFISVFNDLAKNNPVFAINEKNITAQFSYTDAIYTADSNKLGRDWPVPASPTYTQLMAGYTTMMSNTTELISGLTLPIGILPRYDALIVLFGLEDERQKTLGNMKLFWDAYTPLRTNLILSVADSIDGVTAITQTYFTGGLLNATFNGLSESDLVILKGKFCMSPSPICASRQYYDEMKTIAIGRIRETVTRFFPDMYDIYCELNGVTRTTSELAYIFYEGESQLSIDNIVNGIFDDPPRYPKLLGAYELVKLDAAHKKYRNCIPIDIKHRNAPDFIRNFFGY